MKKSEGITLISVMVYIIVLISIIGVVSVITKQFYTNVDDIVIETSFEEQYSKLKKYIIQDINSGKVVEVNCSKNGKNLEFVMLDGSSHIYMFLKSDSNYDDKIMFLKICKNQQNDEIYIDKQIKLCEGINNESKKIFKIDFDSKLIFLNLKMENTLDQNEFQDGFSYNLVKKSEMLYSYLYNDLKSKNILTIKISEDNKDMKIYMNNNYIYEYKIIEDENCVKYTVYGSDGDIISDRNNIVVYNKVKYSKTNFVNGNGNCGIDIVTLNGKKDKMNFEYSIADSNNAVYGSGWVYYKNTFTCKNGEKEVKVGDYVNYNPMEETEEITYTSLEEKNGVGDQSFSSNYTGTWQVLGVDNQGCLMLTSSEAIKRKGLKEYFLNGTDGYLNAVEELNNICKIYGNGKYAKSSRSIDVDDINNITGYINNYNADTINVAQVDNEVTYYKSSDGYVYYKGSKYPSDTNYGSLTSWTENGTKSTSKSFYYLDGRVQKSLANGESVSIKNTWYTYYPQTLSSSSSTGAYIGELNKGVNVYNLLFNGDKNRYWLGSQYINTGTGKVYFGVRIISSYRKNNW